MYTATINDYRIKQDEMLRQAENFRLIQAAQKLHSSASRLLSDDQTAVFSLSSRGSVVNTKRPRRSL